MSSIYKLLFVVIFSLSTLIGYAQSFLVRADAQNILYAGVQNPLSIVVSGMYCNSLVVKTSGGIISKNESSNSGCRYFIEHAEEGVTTISVFKKENKTLKKVGETSFWTKKLPLPEAMVGVLTGDTANKKVLIAMGGVRVVLPLPVDADFSVISYKTFVIRNDSVLAVIHNTGARYNADLVKNLNLIEKGDQIIFSNITVRYPDKTQFVVKPLSYTITE